MKYDPTRKHMVSAKAKARTQAYLISRKIFDDAQEYSKGLAGSIADSLQGEGMDENEAVEFAMDAQWDIHWLMIHEVLVNIAKEMNPSLSEDHKEHEYTRGEA